MLNDEEIPQPPQLTQRGRDFLAWLVQQDHPTRQELNKKMRQIHLHYDRLEKKDKE